MNKIGGDTMEFIGRKVYYNVFSGNVLVITSEMSGNVRKTNFEEDRKSYTELINFDKDAVGVIELEYGQFSEDFSIGTISRVENGKLIWSYSDNTQKPPVDTIIPLTEQVKILERKLKVAMMAIAELYETNSGE